MKKVLSIIIAVAMVFSLTTGFAQIKVAQAQESNETKITFGSDYASQAHAAGAKNEYFSGTGCWYYEHKTDKFEVYFSPDPYVGEITIDDIQSISFRTKKTYQLMVPILLTSTLLSIQNQMVQMINPHGMVIG